MGRRTVLPADPAKLSRPPPPRTKKYYGSREGTLSNFQIQNFRHAEHVKHGHGSVREELAARIRLKQAKIDSL